MHFDSMALRLTCHDINAQEKVINEHSDSTDLHQSRSGPKPESRDPDSRTG